MAFIQLEALNKGKVVQEQKGTTGQRTIKHLKPSIPDRDLATVAKQDLLNEEVAKGVCWAM